MNPDDHFPRRARFRDRWRIVERQGGVCDQCGQPLDLSIRPRYKFEAVSLDGYVAGAKWADVTAVHTFCWHMRRLDEALAKLPPVESTAGDELREPAV